MAAVAGPTPEELQQRWIEAVDALQEAPKNLDLLLQAGTLSEQLGRRSEAYKYYLKAITLDPSQRFLINKLRPLAATPEQTAEVERVAKRPASFQAALGDVFKYPFRGKGLPVLILGAVIFGILRAANSLGYAGPYGVGAAGLIGAYLTMFYVDMCHGTVNGEDEIPDFPDPLRMSEMAVDVGKIAVPMLASFLPVILIVLFGFPSNSDEEFKAPSIPVPAAAPAKHEDDEEDEPAAAAPAAQPPPAPAAPGFPTLPIVGIVAFGVLGLLYLPMATLANVLYGSPWTCLNVPFVLRGIGAAPGNYAICLAASFGAAFVVAGIEAGARIGNVVVISGVALAFVSMYGMAIQMRILGLFYRMNQARLGWLQD